MSVATYRNNFSGGVVRKPPLSVETFRGGTLRTAPFIEGLLVQAQTGGNSPAPLIRIEAFEQSKSADLDSDADADRREILSLVRKSSILNEYQECRVLCEQSGQEFSLAYSLREEIDRIICQSKNEDSCEKVIFCVVHLITRSFHALQFLKITGAN